MSNFIEKSSSTHPRADGKFTLSFIVHTNTHPVWKWVHELDRALKV